MLCRVLFYQIGRGACACKLPLACVGLQGHFTGMTQNIFDRAPEQALEWHKAGRGVALATVVQTWGSAPRRVGSQLVIGDGGEMQGSVSGGCVEGAVMMEALDAVADGKPRVLEYGVSGSVSGRSDLG